MDGKQSVIRTVPVYKDSVKRGEVRILVSTNQSSPGGSSAAGSAGNNSNSNKRPFRPQAGSVSSGPSSTVTSSTLAEKEGQCDGDSSRMRNHGTPIQCKRSFPPLLASLASSSPSLPSSSSPSPPKQHQPGNSGVTLLPYSGSPTTMATSTHGLVSGNGGPSFANCSNGAGSVVHTLASLTARSAVSRPRQNHGHCHQQQHNQDSEMSSEMTPNSKAKHRYETSLGQLTKKFISLLKDAPEGVSSLLLICDSANYFFLIN